MNKHVMALTYAPKIEAVHNGTCTQTIRTIRKKEVCVGDRILFHGWEDTAYRSPWNWEMRVMVTEVIKIEIYNTELLKGIMFPDISSIYVYHWNHSYVDGLAARDYIDPPTGEELHNILFKLNNGKAQKESEKYQIIRWG